MFIVGREYKVRADLKYLPQDVRGRTFEVIRDVSYVKLPTFDNKGSDAKYMLIIVCPRECEEVIKR